MTTRAIDALAFTGWITTQSTYKGKGAAIGYLIGFGLLGLYVISLLVLALIRKQRNRKESPWRRK